MVVVGYIILLKSIKEMPEAPPRRGHFVFIIMKELALEFTGKGEVRGFIFTQVNKSEKAYIYKVDTGSSIHYEVFKRVENTRFNCISYPSSNAFGYWAWCCTSKERAIDIYEQLNRNERVK